MVVAVERTINDSEGLFLFPCMMDKRRAELAEERKSIKLFSRPFHTVYYFLVVVWESLISLIQYSFNSILISSSIVTVAIAVLLLWFLPDQYLQGSMLESRNYYREESEFVFWWILLGVLSSVGLGSGLHTFILFLGPYIIKIAVTASMCNTTDFNTSILWFQNGNFFNLVTHPETAFKCIPVEGVSLSLWSVLLKVQYPSLLWGFGTAIGELPPYFVARAARMKGEKLQELEDSLAEDGDSRMSQMMHRVKEYVYQYIHQYGFVAIMLFASIPNPLFDLAGLTCGHFLVPFWTFFGATAIGKAIIKTALQSTAYVIVFNRNTFDMIVAFIMSRLPYFGFLVKLLEDGIANIAYKSCSNKDRYPTGDECGACCLQMLERESQSTSCVTRCHNPVEEDANSLQNLVKQGWEYCIIAMISYFIYTLIDSSVQHYLQERDERELEEMSKGEKKEKKKVTLATKEEKRKRSPSPAKKSSSGSKTPGGATRAKKVNTDEKLMISFIEKGEVLPSRRSGSKTPHPSKKSQPTSKRSRSVTPSRSSGKGGKSKKQ